MKTTLLNHQHKLHVNPDALTKLVRMLMQPAKRRDRNRNWGTLSVLLTDHEGMSHWHEAFFNDPSTTDVISRAYDPLPGAPVPLDHGELIVNAEMAQDLGPEYGGVARELAFYLAHGIDHLSGGDDLTPRDRRRMHRREQRWLDIASDRGLLNDLILPGSIA